MDNIRPFGPILLLALVFLGPVIGFNFLGMVLGPPLQALMGVLIG